MEDRPGEELCVHGTERAALLLKKPYEECASHIAVVGSRRFPHRSQVEDELLYIRDTNPLVELISGGAKGVDSWVREFAEKNEMNFTEFNMNEIPTEKDGTKLTFGQRAYLRNKAIVIYTKHDPNGLVIAFWDGDSKGTRMTIDIADSNAVPVRVIYPVQPYDLSKLTGAMSKEDKKAYCKTGVFSIMLDSRHVVREYDLVTSLAMDGFTPEQVKYACEMLVREKQIIRTGVASGVIVYALSPEWHKIMKGDSGDGLQSQLHQAAREEYDRLQAHENARQEAIKRDALDFMAAVEKAKEDREQREWDPSPERKWVRSFHNRPRLKRVDVMQYHFDELGRCTCPVREQQLRVCKHEVERKRILMCDSKGIDPFSAEGLAIEVSQFN